MVVKGKRLTQKEHWEKLKAELKGMTFKEKLEHLWEYYKWIPGVFLGLVVIICTVVAAIITLNTETILAGSIINVPVSPEGYVELQTGYYERAKTEGKRQVVELTNMNFVDPYTTVEQTYTMDVLENVTAMVSADVMDYLLCDDVALPFFLEPEMFADLRKLFTDEELEAMGNAVIKLEMEDGSLIPIAIEISDTTFYSKYMEVERPIYLLFSIRLPRKETCQDFWQFIKGGKTASMQTAIAGTVVDAPLTEEGHAQLQEGFFKAQGYTLGDHRVELTEQSFQPAVDYEGEDLAPKVKAHVLSTLKDGSLDYVVFGQGALDTLDKADLLDLTQMGQLPEDGVIYDGQRPVAVKLSALGFTGTEGDAYLAFSANTKKLDICTELWNYISK